jgi:hypothetical protein
MPMTADDEAVIPGPHLVTKPGMARPPYSSKDKICPPKAFCPIDFLKPRDKSDQGSWGCSMSTVLILGSGPSVTQCREWARPPFDTIIAINNAWQVRPDWDYLIHPEDFPEDRRPQTVAAHQKFITAEDYVPLQNTLGGFVYAGGTMAFTAGYWALAALRPKVMAFLGCDMTYDAAQTHFYGTGAADPLRKDVTLRSLEAKSARLMRLAALRGCATVNLSHDPSRLVFPRSTPEGAAQAMPQAFETEALSDAQALEDTLDYRVPSGRYWKEEARFDTDDIDRLDALWLKSARPFRTAS